MKKKNISNTMNSFRFLKKLNIILIVFFSFNGCFSIFKMTPVLEENKSEILKADKEFILLNQDLLPIENPDFTKLDSKIKSIHKSKSFHDLNNLAVYGVKLSYIESSEEIFRNLQKEKPNETAPFLNLLRIYYLLDEYKIAKKMLKEYYKAHSGDKTKVFDFLKYLKSKNRIEEHVLFLDVISNYPDYEIHALEELGLYFLSIRDLETSEIYFQKILKIHAYNPIALNSMMVIKMFNESWKDVILYATPLRKENSKGKDYYSILAKAYFELGEYTESIKASVEAPEIEKNSLDFLIVWRDSILCNDLRGSLIPLKRYFHLVKKTNPTLNEDDFFTASSKEGKQTITNLLNGY